MASPIEVPEGLVPEGWTIELSQVNCEYTWGNRNAPGHQMASTFGLKNPQPIMCRTLDTGEPGYVFESDGKYYFWGQLEGTILEVYKPRGLDKILEEMKVKGEKGLKVRELGQLYAYE